VYIRRDTYKGDTETGQQLQAIHGDEAELTCSRCKRIGKGEHQERSYQSEVERIPFTMLEERTQSASDGCLTRYLLRNLVRCIGNVHSSRS